MADPIYPDRPRKPIRMPIPSSLIVPLGLLFACAGLLMFALAAYSAIRPASLLVKGQRSRGLVISDRIYRNHLGQKRRFYRVTVNLSTGQMAELRSRSTKSRRSPKIGDVVPVVLWERPAGPKAEIATFGHLWFAVSVFSGLAIGFVAFAAFIFSGRLS